MFIRSNAGICIIIFCGGGLKIEKMQTHAVACSFCNSVVYGWLCNQRTERRGIAKYKRESRRIIYNRRGKKEKEITTLRWGIIGEYNFVGDDIEFIDKKRASKVNATLKEKD